MINGFVSIIFLFNLHYNTYKLYTLVTLLNLETIICDKKALEDYIANPFDKVTTQDQINYKECEKISLIIGWIILIPRALVQSYIIMEYKKIKNNINQMDVTKHHPNYEIE